MAANVSRGAPRAAGTKLTGCSALNRFTSLPSVLRYGLQTVKVGVRFRVARAGGSFTALRRKSHDGPAPVRCHAVADAHRCGHVLLQITTARPMCCIPLFLKGWLRVIERPITAFA